jgi:hypothetical protein
VLLGKSTLGRFNTLVAPPESENDALTACERLALLWKTAYTHVMEEGPRLFSERFVALSFEDFCRRPDAFLRSISELGGLPYAPRDLSWIRSPRPGYRPRDPRWRAVLRGAGLEEFAKD